MKGKTVLHSLNSWGYYSLTITLLDTQTRKIRGTFAWICVWKRDDADLIANGLGRRAICPELCHSRVGPLRREDAEAGDWLGWRRVGGRGSRLERRRGLGGARREIEAEGPRFTAVSLDFCTTHQNSAAWRLKLGGRAVIRSEGLTLTLHSEAIRQAPPTFELQLL